MSMGLLDGWFKLDVGEGAFYSIFGFVFVFLGIALLIAIFVLLGIIMKRVNYRSKEPKKPKEKDEKIVTGAPITAIPTGDEGLSPEIVAVISAAIAAYYEGSAQKCDFVVRRIKRL